jgi:hypothetical protein
VRNVTNMLLVGHGGHQSRQVYVASGDTDAKEKHKSWDVSSSIQFGNVTVFHVSKTAKQQKVAPSQAYSANIDVYAELVVLIESECLIGSNSGFSEMAPMVSVSTEETRTRCSLRFNECGRDNVETQLRLLH